MAHNNNAWQFCSISDVEFYSTSTSNHFMRSYSTGQPQSWTFERIRFCGSWGYTFLLEGADTNSEMNWREVDWAGTCTKGVYVPSATGSDQFLNYNFYSCNFEVQEGDFLHFEKGGNITVWGGSYIHIGANAGTFFKLLGATHSYGVERVPVNARIVNIFLQSPSGAVTSTGAATFTVLTTEATPTVLATLTAPNHSQGFLLKQDLYFRCDTAEKCSLQLVAGSNVTQANPEAECIVEYIG